MNGYEKEIVLNTKFLAELEEEAPPKFFKKSYAEWQEKMDEVRKKIDELNKKLYEEYSQVGEQTKLLQENQ